MCPTSCHSLAEADIVCAEDRAALKELFDNAAMTTAHNNRCVAELEHKLKSSHGKLEHFLQEKLVMCSNNIVKQHMELSAALQAMEEVRELEFIRDNAVRLGLLSLADIDDLRAPKWARGEQCSTESKAMVGMRSRSASLSTEACKRERSPSLPTASKSLANIPTNDPSSGALEEELTPTPLSLLALTR